MSSYKYQVGQVVEAARNMRSVIPIGRYEIVRHMPPTVGGDNQYQIKSLRDRHQRVVKESDLAATPI
jgi:hypothetical protein